MSATVYFREKEDPRVKRICICKLIYTWTVLSLVIKQLTSAKKVNHRRYIDGRHDGTVGRALGFGLSHPKSKSGLDNCVEALSPHRVTAVGKLLTLNCLGGDWPSFTFVLTLLLSDCGLSVVSNKRIFIYLLISAILKSLLNELNA